ncbi:MAG TPA: PDZ domain-containing protein [Haliangium sp.]|nr:PDZ domain-containing protein [Haliangium sp.]
MRSISRLAVFAALFGTGLSAHADPSMPDAHEPLGMGPMVAQAPVTLAAPARESLGEAPRASVAAIMHEAGQALLWDSARGEYVVVRAGGTFQGFHVSAISAEQVVLSRGNQHFVLPRVAEAPDLARRAPASANQAAQPMQPAQGQGSLVDPYASAGAPAQPSAVPEPISAQGSISAQAPMDPYASSAPTAPAAPPPAFFSPDELPPTPAPMVLDPYAAPAAPAPAPIAPSLPSSLLESRVKPMPRASAEPRKSAESSAPVAANDTARVTSMPRPVIQSQGEAASLRDEQHSLSRKEFDAAISDFDALARDMQVSLTADGVRVDEVAPASLAYRMGVRAEDVVLDVDGKKLRSVNDAAAIYARLMDAERFAVKVRRGTGIITLRYQFTR